MLVFSWWNFIYTDRTVLAKTHALVDVFRGRCLLSSDRQGFQQIIKTLFGTALYRVRRSGHGGGIFQRLPFQYSPENAGVGLYRYAVQYRRTGLPFIQYFMGIT